MIPGYRNFERIGSGGFAVVYRARQTAVDRIVAVKVLTVDLVDDRARRRFQREAQLMAALSDHPNIVTLHDSGFTTEGKPFLTLEYYEQGSLADRLQREGPLPVEDVLRIGVKIAGALDTAHAGSIIHRDIKPPNILINRFGEPGLTDFGISVVSSVEASLTTDALTPWHAPPEILEGRPPTVSSDVYSLASTLYTLLAGRAPYQGDTDESLLALLTRMTSTPAPRLDRADVPARVTEVLMGALDRTPARRPATAAALGAQLQQVQAGLGLVVTELVSPAGPPPTTAATLPDAPAPVSGWAGQPPAGQSPEGPPGGPSPDRAPARPPGAPTAGGGHQTAGVVPPGANDVSPGRPQPAGPGYRHPPTVEEEVRTFIADGVAQTTEPDQVRTTWPHPPGPIGTDPAGTVVLPDGGGTPARRRPTGPQPGAAWSAPADAGPVRAASPGHTIARPEAARSPDIPLPEAPEDRSHLLFWLLGGAVVVALVTTFIILWPRTGPVASTPASAARSGPPPTSVRAGPALTSAAQSAPVTPRVAVGSDGTSATVEWDPFPGVADGRWPYTVLVFVDGQLDDHALITLTAGTNTADVLGLIAGQAACFRVVAALPDGGVQRSEDACINGGRPPAP